MTVYYKMAQILLQNASDFSLQNPTFLLKNATVITNCDSHYKLQKVITNCNGTMIGGVAIT